MPSSNQDLASLFGGFTGASGSVGGTPGTHSDLAGDQWDAYEEGKDPLGRTNKRLDKVWDDPFNRGSMEILQPTASYKWGEKGPWSAQQPYLQDMFARASSLVGRGQDPASVEAQMRRLFQSQNMGGMLSYLGGYTGNMLGGAGGTLANTQPAMNFLLDPRMLTPDANPFLAAMGQAVAGTTTQNLLQNILPQVRGGAVDAGQYGGSRQGVMEGLSIGGTSTAISNALANMYGGSYQQGIGNMLNAIAQSNQQAGLMGQLAQQTPGIGASLAAMYDLPASMLSQVGQERSQFPWWQLAQYRGIVGDPRYGSTERGVTTDPGYKVGESMIGSFTGGQGIMGAVGAFCWVADELYGAGSEKAAAIRRFNMRHLLDDSALGGFIRQYARVGREWAERVRSDSAFRQRAQRLWDDLYTLALEG